MELVSQKDLGSVRMPRGGDKVYKDECVYSFDTPVRASREFTCTCTCTCRHTLPNLLRSCNALSSSLPP